MSGVPGDKIFMDGFWSMRRKTIKKGLLSVRKCLRKKLIYAVDESMGRIFNMSNFYRFHMDRDDIADNLVKEWKENVGDPLEVSMNLVSLATDVYQQAIVEDEEDGEGDEDDLNTIDVAAALKSAEQKKYINAVAEISKIRI